jgi:hypothetical protein
MKYLISQPTWALTGILFHHALRTLEGYGKLMLIDKNHLFKTMKERFYTFEECYTLLCQIEAILNSRPLTPLSDDTSDFMPLTPARFLVGGPITSYPEPSFEVTPDSRLSRWEAIEKQRQIFWSRWSKEYLTVLQQRNKWKDAEPNLHVGQLVILAVENAPPLVWPTARICEL